MWINDSMDEIERLRMEEKQERNENDTLGV